MNTLQVASIKNLKELLSNLTLHDYWEAIGTEKLLLVCEHAETSFSYYKLMAYYLKACSPAMFERIERAAAELTPGIAPDYSTCTRPSRIAAIREQRAANKTAGTRTARRLKPGIFSTAPNA